MTLPHTLLSRRQLTGLATEQFRTEEWSLETEDGQVVQLLEQDTDPFRQGN